MVYIEHNRNRDTTSMLSNCTKQFSDYYSPEESSVELMTLADIISGRVAVTMMHFTVL